MSGISQLLETARRALITQQFGIAVTGHNIANAGTAGYSRQRADLVATPPSQTYNGLLGTGVTVEGVTRLRNSFIDQQIRSSNNSLGSSTSDYQILSQVEATFNEPSDSALSGTLNKFFSAWQDLSTHPEDSVARNALMLQGQDVSDSFHRLYNDTSNFRNSLRDEFSSKIDRINTLSKEISDLNVSITANATGGGNPSDMKDMLDTKIDELSKLANITVSEGPNGTSLVALGGTTIAGNGSSLALKIATGATASVSGSTFDQLRVTTELGGTAVNLTGGEAGSILKSYNTAIPDTLGRLNTLAGGIISSVNALHSAGYGEQQPAKSGINFFMGSDALSINIDLTDPSSAPGSNPNLANIAASSSATTSGGNSVALAIAGLQDKRPLVSGTGATMLDGLSITEYYNRMVTNVGSAVNSADTLQQSQESVVSQLTAQQDGVAGVSLDEEMTNLIEFQKSFEAAAKIVNTVSEMYDTIIQMV
jgi:flagellar hook-associated protein 1 FlgK